MKQGLSVLVLCATILLAPACWRRRSCCTTAAPVYQTACPAPTYDSASAVPTTEVIEANGYTAGYSAEEGVAHVEYAQNGEETDQDFLDDESDFDDMDLK